MSAEQKGGCFLCFPVILFLCLLSIPAWAGETAVLAGKVVDVDGRAVEGARVFVYDSRDVRRSAQFISALTERDGSFRLVMVPGRYWVMARLKKAEGYGPLTAGDKHSGEPEEVEIGAQQEVSMTFAIADLRDARQMRSADREGPVRLSGRVLGAKGAPAENSYVIANTTEKITGMPDYLSAWTDQAGNYVLYLPRGTYYLGAADEFPPARGQVLKGPVSIEADRSDLDISKSMPGKP